MALGMVGLTFLLAACTSSAPTPPGQTAPGSVSTGPKTLQLAFRDEPSAIHGGSTGTPEREIGELLNAGLTTYSATGELVPKLAVKVPSVADGDWVVAPDNSMQLTWKLKPNLKWHDGVPLTADDFVLAHQIFKDSGWTAAIPSGVVTPGTTSNGTPASANSWPSWSKGWSAS